MSTPKLVHVFCRLSARLFLHRGIPGGSSGCHVLAGLETSGTSVAARCEASHARAAPGIEPGTSRTLSENHATRPSSHMTGTAEAVCWIWGPGPSWRAGRRRARRNVHAQARPCLLPPFSPAFLAPRHTRGLFWMSCSCGAGGFWNICGSTLRGKPRQGCSGN